MDLKETRKILEQYRPSMAKVGRLNLDKEIYKNCAKSIDAEISRCKQIAESIENKINEIENLVYREVLIRRYIYGETNEHIAEALCYSPRHIQRIISDAVVEFQKIQTRYS